MDSKHIERDYSAHKKSVIRPYDEYVKLEIFSFDPKDTATYLREDDTLPKGSNCTETSWKSWSCFKSADKQGDMKFSIKYNVFETGEYRIDLVYEQNDYIHDGKTNTGKDLIGHLKIGDEYDSDISFDGENNVIKRNTTFATLKKGGKTLTIKVPHNCYFYGVIIRRVLKYVGDNYYGDSLGSEEGNMVLTACTITNSDMSKPTELSATIFYDDVFECVDSPSGFYIDYHDECNFYVKSNTGEIIQIFGGYVSSILPDADRTKLTIACADRLIDGQNKYVLDQMRIGGGATEEDKSYTKLTKDFDNYASALKYLCDIHETTLKSNISSKYTVDGEDFHEGFTITFGKTKKITKINTNNGIATSNEKYIMLRNKSESKKKQTWNLYDAKDHAKKPIEITKYPYFHIKYGLGKPKTSWTTKTTEKVDTADTTAGSQNFNKCGQSSDGKYVIGIGQPSSGRHEGYSYNTIWKTVFENKCPWCGGKLVWDYARTGANCVHCGGYSGSKRTWGPIPETEITCSHCCADYCAVTGWDKNGHFSKRLKTVSKPVKSSKSEQLQLHQGKLSAVPSSSTEATPDDIFKAITKLAFKYKYKLGAGSSSYSSLKRTGYGDCWAFSELIFTELKRYGVSCKIVQYDSGYASNHRTVMYKNSKGEWADFPYREQGWGSRYNNMLNNYPIGRSKHGTVIQEYKGSNIGKIKASKNTKKTQTSSVTHTKGYDKDKPFQGYLRVTYSLEQSFKAKKYNLDIKFTYEPSTANSLSGMTTYWVNNTIKKSTLRLTNDKNLMDYFKAIHGEKCRIFLQSIQMIAPKIPLKKKDDGSYEDTNWYKSDNSTDDQSSCKMDLYQITFDDNQDADPSDLASCGKSVNSMLKELVDKAGYSIEMKYGVHRKDDQINFRVITNSNERYTASEGDNNNILSWNSISYSPINGLFNLSLQVFKKSDEKYKYVDTKDALSILNYGEQCTLQTNNDKLSEKEAYFNAIQSTKFNPSQTYTFTITVPNCPNLTIGDYVKVVANAKKLNTIKQVKSIKVAFDSGKMPRIQTEIGLDELAPNIQLSENIRALRQSAKEESTEFSSSATPVTNDIYYEWDR